MSIAPEQTQFLVTVAELAAVTFLVGLIIGFIGAGGAGVAVAIMTTIFGLPAHTAVGTAIAAMLFVTASGSLSHFREGNVAWKLGLVMGLAGAVGAVIGADWSQAVPDETLATAAGIALWILAALVWVRTRVTPATVAALEWHGEPERGPREWGAAMGIGAAGGAGAAFFGVGMAPFLQLGLLVVHHLPLRQTVGTTMLALAFISAAGGTAMARHGDVSLPHLIGLTIGLGIGAFIGARYTRRAPRVFLRAAVILVPFVAGAMLLFL
ncbi:MAG: sulfite exporter TauE/SafE family protein [Thermomicrobiales bacterium]|nr:sulfite exporter TauE/SafE family protein [Thermomicrobiales bacterium]